MDDVGPRRTLPPRVLRGAAALSTLLGSLADAGDALWTLTAVPPERVADVPGLPPIPRFSGPLERVPRPAAVLAWMETPSVARYRSAGGARPEATGGASPAVPATLRARLWAVAPPPAEAVRAVSHRRFCLGLERGAQLELPGSRFVASVEEIRRHLLEGGAGAGGGRWVAKAPFSAAGRSRVIAGQGAIERTSVRRALEDLLATHGELLFEPWVRRSADFAITGIVGGRSVEILGAHALEVDGRGGFRGVSIDLEDPERVEGLTAAETACALGHARAVGESLRTAGFRGPFGVDGWRWTDPSGKEVLHPIGEVNPRLTYGVVARALLERLCLPAALPRARRARLRVRWTSPSPPPQRAIPLLRAGPDDPTTAWIEVEG